MVVRTNMKRWVVLGVLCVALAFFHIQKNTGNILRGVLLNSIARPFVAAAPFVAPDGENAAKEQDALVVTLEAENAALKRTLAVTGSTVHESVLTSVLWYDPDPSVRAVRIAIPKGVAIAVGEAVVAPGEILVGRVTARNERTADVLLVDDPSFTLSVAIGDQVGFAKGNGHGGLTIDFIPVAKSPENGAKVISTGREGIIPAGLFVGWGALRAAVAGEPFAQLSIVPGVNLDTLSQLFVLQTGNSFGKTP